MEKHRCRGGYFHGAEDNIDFRGYPVEFKGKSYFDKSITIEWAVMKPFAVSMTATSALSHRFASDNGDMEG